MPFHNFSRYTFGGVLSYRPRGWGKIAMMLPAFIALTECALPLPQPQADRYDVGNDVTMASSNPYQMSQSSAQQFQPPITPQSVTPPPSPDLPVITEVPGYYSAGARLLGQQTDPDTGVVMQYATLDGQSCRSPALTSLPPNSDVGNSGVNFYGAVPFKINLKNDKVTRHIIDNMVRYIDKTCPDFRGQTDIWIFLFNANFSGALVDSYEPPRGPCAPCVSDAAAVNVELDLDSMGKPDIYSYFNRISGVPADKQQENLNQEMLAREINGAQEWTSDSQNGDGSVLIFRNHLFGEDLETVYRSEAAQQHNMYSVDGSTVGMPGVTILSDTVGLLTTGAGLNYYFMNGKLTAFKYAVSSTQANDTIQAMVAKYGKANDVEKGTVQNDLGATFENVVATWNTPQGDLRFQERPEEVDISVIDFNMDAISKSQPKPF